MNVLVYSGPEILHESLNQALASLKDIVSPHYTVQALSLKTITTEPWQNTCAMLVVPRSRKTFISASSKFIKQFIESGGNLLMVGTGASATPRSGGLGMGLASLSLGQEDRETPLKFLDKINNIYLTFDQDEVLDNIAPRLVDLQTPYRASVYQYGLSKFKGFESLTGVSAISHYIEDEKLPAGLCLGIGKGKLCLWGPNIEYSLKDDPLASFISKSTKLSVQDIEESEKYRKELLRATLRQLGLQIPEHDEGKQAISRPFPQFLTSTPSNHTAVSHIMDALASPRGGMQLTNFKDENDEFCFHNLQGSEKLMESSKEASKTQTDPTSWQPKHIIVSPSGDLPQGNLTPLFELDLFYKSLAAARQKNIASPSTISWGMGDVLLYGEVVTSTQTMLDKNPSFLSRMPTPLLSLATYQLAARGRGSNVWLSSFGCLQFSLLLRVSLSDFSASKLVFIQYLFAVAVVEACQDESVLGQKIGEKIRLKWPNDIYASVGPRKEDYKKIGGILVNTSFSGGKVDIVIGCGLNVLNPPPFTSLLQIQPAAAGRLSMEKTTAAIMAKFDSMWSIFMQGRGSFEPFLDLYLKYWLHSDQPVTLTTTTPHTSVRILGITLDHGLLRTIRERSGSIGGQREGDDAEYIDLQPDGNSFDLMANLIKSKS